MKTYLILPFGLTSNDASEEVWASHFVNDLEVNKTCGNTSQYTDKRLNSLCIMPLVYSDLTICLESFKTLII